MVMIEPVEDKHHDVHVIFPYHDDVDDSSLLLMHQNVQTMHLTSFPFWISFSPCFSGIKKKE